MKMLCHLAVAAAVLTATSSPAAEEPAAALKPNALLENMETFLSETNRVSYAIGVNIARNLEANFPQLNFDFFLLGLRDIFSKERLKLNEDEINRSIARYNEISTSHLRKQFNDFKADNLQIAERFLEQNRAKEGVVTLPSKARVSAASASGSSPNSKSRSGSPASGKGACAPSQSRRPASTNCPVGSPRTSGSALARRKNSCRSYSSVTP